ncbi:hypothetical protein DERP_001262 [Dermatophagoides pteronyssinus]|uniref:Uncharacterized protein n=1 Tax=Dermatophagoides pteronyssinus TaxID=6956 RepID=A0ABQ8JDY9_DERPT|nr:hypothetical protein DERP_001262 [Dermatophagoides pteronyssinus]
MKHQIGFNISGECIHFENEPKTMNILNGGSTNSKTVSGKCDKV